MVFAYLPGDPVFVKEKTLPRYLKNQIDKGLEAL
jgi:hypothetical protein